ncbi:MAG: carboxylating nicotinate-nucleotide diphosphorylase [Candidatus Eisenbacteria bacterium]|uniref:Probable nicotinate-nucleotide pyrophosphorylase [carboxylating] n=1 Tax=Eiseniibacteriota bacterium TaxID=2212470 RepID=A0A9D6L9S2_UNCEI|nr:carboxylating nicotinate-nucleotide diphosphorylase [Candidatus Eisenbacteria bacterium]MBI3539253.1 carboxylating nicotinate-nucleotide diphosphorylase [Candidatus Eisenbacteria bacterium]
MLEAVALPLVKYALSEDVGTGDITSLNTIPSGVNARAAIVAKEAGVIAGLDVARLTFREADPHLKFRAVALDGDAVTPGVAVAQVVGDAGSVLKAERTALNFLQRLSGVATLTRRYVDRIAGTGAVILDTRKTTPGLRFLEKYAVQVGGGQNHRLALWDMYLVKDNHIRAAGGLTAAIDRIARTRQGDLLLEVEVESLDQLREALRPDVDRILVDNRPVEEVRRAVEAVDAWCRGRTLDSARMREGARRWPEVEVSGGVTLDTVRAYAETGVDYVSVGALTHSAPALDVSLEIEEVG